MTEPANPPDERPRTLPVWVRVADVLGLALAGLALITAQGGGFRLRAGDVRVSVTSAWRIALAAAVILLVRHVAHRKYPVYRRIWSGLRAASRADGLREVLPAWTLSRFGVLLVGLLAVGSLGFRDNTVPFRLYENEIINLPARYDAGWYLNIAAEGYRAYFPASVQQNIAFMPALPMLMRIGGRLLGGQPLWAGQVVVLVAGLWGFMYVYRLARSDLGDANRAGLAVALLAAYPFAVFFSAVYTESIFLLCCAGGFYHAMRREHWRTAAFALLCGFTRPNGFLLAVPLALVALWPGIADAWRRRSAGFAAGVGRAVRDSVPSIIAAGAAGVGVVAFSAFVFALTGHPLAWLEAHSAWGRTFGSWVTKGPFQEGGLYQYLLTQPADALNFVAIVGFLAAIWPVTRRLGVPYGVFLAVNLIPPFLMGGTLSIGRVTSVMFPVFIWLASVVPPGHRAAWLTLFALLQGWGATLFFTWRTFI